jgi:DNA-binding NtrC family response regulator
LRILIVEDDPDQRFLTAAMLRLLGYEAIEAHSAEAALDRLSSDDRITAVLTDIRLPQLDGSELVRRIQRLYPALPVGIISVYSHAEWITQGVESGSLHYLEKPFRADQLAETVKAMLGPCASEL